MLSIKVVFGVSLLYYFASGTIIQDQSPSSPPKNIPVSASTPLSKECGPNKSLHSRNDIKVMINFIYNETSLDNKIKQNYQAKAEAIRDKHLQDIKDFTVWFENQPEHLKDILHRLERTRKLQVEPVVEIVAGVLKEYPKLEMSYNKKNDSANKLLNKLNKYSMICKLNCEEQVKVHNISKRNVQDDFYCSSIEDLHREITVKLNESAEKINNVTLNNISLSDKKYEDKIDEIKSKLKDKALNKFGRTMYEILSLEFEYNQFMNDMTSIDVHEAVYDIKRLGLQVDAGLMQLEQAIEKYGQHCKTCSKILVRNARKADLESEEKRTTAPPNLVDELIETKYNEVTTEVAVDWKKIFHDLDTLIQKTEIDEHTMNKLKPLEEEINSMTNSEKEALTKLKTLAPSSTIRRLVKLIRKLMDLIKFIKHILDLFPIPIPTPIPVPT